ncbi:MAG: rod shape-determining protein RodA [bacterium]|nr:rod shape-determining protein RodA [bacterium]
MNSFSKPISRIAPLTSDDASPLRRLGNVHWGPLAAALCLSFIGLATVHSASADLPIDHLPKQALWVAIGCVALTVIFSIGYHRLVALSPILYALGLGLLILVLILGHRSGGAKSWFAIGPVSIQPSEFAKLATALLLTRYLSLIKSPTLRVREIVTVCALAGVPMVLIALENDLGSAAMFLPVAGALLLVCGVRWRQLLLAGLLGAVLAAGMWSFGMREYQRTRIVSFFSPDQDPLGAGYQVRQSKIAVGSGQWLGRGYMQGTQSQLRFLPERHTDFIMAVLAEEWGFLGVVAVLGLYSLFVTTGANIAMRSRDRAGILLVVALLAMFAFHALYNAAMVVGLLPVTGIPLPFLSYGGSFTLVNFLATGLILNVDFRRYVNR